MPTSRAKAEAAQRAGLVAIVCVGETRDEREAGRTLDVVRGSSRARFPDGADGRQSGRRLRAGLGDRHRPDARRPRTSPRSMRHIRAELAELVGRGEQSKVRILYGGSVKPRTPPS